MRRPAKDKPNTRFHGRVEDNGRRCEQPGCTEPGEFRAPGAVSRPADQPRGYRWFCLDHVREFNARYNFFSGMTPEEISDAQRPFSGWERETRAFASAGGDVPPRWADFSDPLDAIGARFQRKVAPERRDGRALSDGDRKAMRIMGLAVDADRAALRKRYAELLQRYHPDRNGGDRTHEHALREVIEAYQRLRNAPAFAPAP
ncbi:J domain-containing protein [Hephaestia sp. GCM10023244]|uniref:J domain-containing protein n=1 Tax=unclassified Hephaestia TaxID=2631281 RepID=UPI0020774BFA|nr:J domain-containing protein [Hephaestia sp. MAHUQ-44]MCM8729909.1 J domain-containing protein [Hephaestia sp. MAHUQ-44]